MGCGCYSAEPVRPDSIFRAERTVGRRGTGSWKGEIRHELWASKITRIVGSPAFAETTRNNKDDCLNLVSNCFDSPTSTCTPLCPSLHFPWPVFFKAISICPHPPFQARYRSPVPVPLGLHLRWKLLRAKWLVMRQLSYPRASINI